MNSVEITPEMAEAMGAAHSIMEASATNFTGMVFTELRRRPDKMPAGFETYLRAHSQFEVDDISIVAHSAPNGPYGVLYDFVDSFLWIEPASMAEEVIDEFVNDTLSPIVDDLINDICPRDGVVAFTIEHLPEDLNRATAQALFHCFDLEHLCPVGDGATISALRACQSTAFQMVCADHGITDWFTND